MKFEDPRTRAFFGDYPDCVLSRFAKFHRDNPVIYQTFRLYAREMKASGRKKYSSEIIINRMRWEIDLRSEGEPFKINNDFKPLYARLLAWHEPEFEKFFEFRRVTSKGIKSTEQRERELEDGTKYK